MSDIYLVITPNGLKGSISSLVKQKEERGYEVVVKAVEDFMNGSQAPYVLMREYVLNKKPKCLLLVGDYDEMPGYPLETPDGTTYLSDVYFGMQSNDPVPQIPTGRLSSNNPHELKNICELLVSYPNNPYPKWKRRIILTGWIPRGPDCSDMNYEEDAGWACVNEIDEYYEIVKRFENDKTIENDVSSPLGNGAQRREIWEVKGTSKQDLIDAIEEGALIVRYHGHGSPNAWHNIGIHNDIDELFGINDIKTLNVGNKLPLVISASCLTGHIKASPSFSEAWQKYRKAIGVFAADVSSSTYWNDRITQLIFHEIISCQKHRVGEVLVDAMKRLHEKYGNVNAVFMRTFRMYRYLGDPDTILAYPLPRFPRFPPGSTIKFDWEKMMAIAMWVREHWDIIFPPIGGPRPRHVPYLPDKMPSYLSDIYRSGFTFLSKLEHIEFPERSVEHIAKLLEKVPVGSRFTQSMQKPVLEALKKFKGSKKDILPVSGKLLEAINAMDLDWRVSSMPTREVKSGKKTTVDFRGVVWITFKDVKEPGDCSLRVEGSLPALVEGFQPGWPIASYHFDFKGKLAENVDISFYIGGISFPGQSFSPRVFEWDGKSYNDITTNIDFRREVIIGRTNRLSTYVIMNHIPESKEPRPSFVLANCAEGLGLFDQECKDKEGTGYPFIDKQMLYEGKQTCKAIDMCGIQAHAGYYMIGSGGKEFTVDIDKYPSLYLTMKAEKGTDTCLLLVVHDKKPRDFMRRFVAIGTTDSEKKHCGVRPAEDCFTIKDDNEWQDYTYDLRKLREEGYPDAKTVRMVQFYSGKLCNGKQHAFHFSSLVFKK